MNSENTLQEPKNAWMSYLERNLKEYVFKNGMLLQYN